MLGTIGLGRAILRRMRLDWAVVLSAVVLLTAATSLLATAALRAIVRTDGITAIVATHDVAMLDVADRVIELHDGRLVAASTWP